MYRNGTFFVCEEQIRRISWSWTLTLGGTGFRPFWQNCEQFAKCMIGRHIQVTFQLKKSCLSNLYDRQLKSIWAHLATQDWWKLSCMRKFWRGKDDSTVKCLEYEYCLWCRGRALKVHKAVARPLRQRETRCVYGIYQPWYRSPVESGSPYAATSTLAAGTQKN